ncbi:MAG: cell division protein FtsA [Chloroflexi bacterium]|nr:MAG: cell division protein FtsA [Chloroflexota bacterium]
MILAARPPNNFVSGGIPAQPLLRRKRVVGLDLGTSKVAVVIGVGETPSDGLRKGVVVNIEKTVQAIHQAAQSAERMAGVRFDSVVVSLAGPHLMSQVSRGVIAVARPDREIGQDDVSRVVDASRAVSVASDRELIHVIPRTFTVDGQEGVKEAAGMTGTRLEVETHIVTGAQTSVQNVIKCVHQAGFDVEDVVSQGLAAGQAVLSPNEMELGVGLMDLGAGTTDVVIFNEGAALQLAVLPVGGNHITSDIAIGLRTTLDEAETLKLNYGHTLTGVIPPEEKIEVHEVGGDRVQAVPRRYLAEIIGPRVREIFQMAREEVRRCGYDGLLPAGLVVTGGSARLLGTIDAAGQIFNSSVRLGLPQGVGGLADRVSGPSFATGVGLVRWGSKLQPVTNGKHLNGGNVTATYQKSVRWLRDFF